MTKIQSVLIIDDEKQIRKILSINLTANNYKIIEAEDGKEGINKAASEKPDAIILDLGLPDEDGQKILLKLREWYVQPIIILSVRNSEKDIIMALDSGANDYLTKPFTMGELLARLRVCFRQSKDNESTSVFVNGPLKVDFTNRTVSKNDEIIKLTSTEYSILWLFIHNIGKVLTHKYILHQIWGNNYEQETQYLRVYISQLRKKIEDDVSAPKFILTESGIGYRLSFYE